ncbi:MAG: zinc-dependent metalloprotease [Gammaproteobacteria bacterium]
MKLKLLILSALVLCAGCSSLPSEKTDAPQQAKSTATTQKGYFDFDWDKASGKIFLHVKELETPFIYQTSLARGIGSNDIGADRGRLGDTKLVEFYRSGNKLLLIENNTSYRANSDNASEKRAVEESFARSVIWGFEIDQTDGATLIVDATDFLLRDSLSLSQWLGGMNEGNYNVDKSRSAIYLPRTRTFEDNTEFEAILTLTGVATGSVLPTVVPDSSAITVHTHHSFIRLPEPGFVPLTFDPRSGYISPTYGGSFADYAVPISSPMTTSFARRHRLEKKDPLSPMSEAVEPIVYYLDPGAPEPVRTALLDGARWWNQAYEAAGYKNAFQVKMLPPDADPMDVRYNVIQWVHRSTRGWSYGSSVLDPRTGEILKGHVSLGSLRVRQDYLLAEGFLAPYSGSASAQEMEAFSLARIRQLSAHEVGHTIGLAHNFAGSVNNRSTVMDYPFPFVTLESDGRIDLSDAYAEGIGEWDKRAIIWGYQDFPDNVDANKARAEILEQTLKSGLKFVADRDSRHPGGTNIDGNLWDNGAEPVEELNRLMQLRAQVLNNFSAANIPTGRPMATLEEVLVPMYLLHRFQIQAAGKVLGGGYYTYDLKGDGQPAFEQASATSQQRALEALLNTLSPNALLLPKHIPGLISPRPPGHARGRETFDRKTRHTFDQYAPADAAIALTLQVLLEPSRVERLQALEAANFGFGLSDVINGILDRSIRAPRRSGRAGEIQRRVNNNVIQTLVEVTSSDQATDVMRGTALYALGQVNQRLSSRSSGDLLWAAHDANLKRKLSLALEGNGPTPMNKIKPPPGSPIG